MGWAFLFFGELDGMRGWLTGGGGVTAAGLWSENCPFCGWLLFDREDG